LGTDASSLRRGRTVVAVAPLASTGLSLPGLSLDVKLPGAARGRFDSDDAPNSSISVEPTRTLTGPFRCSHAAPAAQVVTIIASRSA